MTSEVIWRPQPQRKLDYFSEKRRKEHLEAAEQVNGSYYIALDTADL